MPIIAKASESSFSPAPEGLHQAVCVDVVDLGMQETPWGPKHKVELRWQLDQVDPVSAQKGTARRYMVTNRYTLSLSEKATLRHHLEAWRGKRFTHEELEGFDLEVLVGINCQLQVVHNVKSEGRVWAAVQAIVPLGKGMAKLEPENYVRAKDRDHEDAFDDGRTLDGAEDAPF